MATITTDQAGTGISVGSKVHVEFTIVSLDQWGNAVCKTIERASGSQSLLTYNFQKQHLISG